RTAAVPAGRPQRTGPAAAPPPPAATLPSDPVEEIFSLDLEDASPPAAKPATAEIFSLDLDDAPAAPPPPAPKPAPARSPAVSISPPTGEFFSLDADEPPAPSMASPSATVAPAPASDVSTAA